MLEAAGQPVLDALTAATGVRVRLCGALEPEAARAVLEALRPRGDERVDLRVGGERYGAVRFERGEQSVVVLGPYRRPEDSESPAPLLDPEAEARALTALAAAGAALKRTLADRRRYLEVASQLELVGSAAVAITGELALETVLRRIVDLVREVAGARYAALGIPDERGGLAEFIFSGLTEEAARRIGALPTGRGILNLLLKEPQTIRIADLSRHPAAVGFPPYHPPMKSFLGVPIVSRGHVLGNLYLTEKRVGDEFTVEDEQLVELLARHAAVAIENARLYRRQATEQNRLQTIIDQLPEAVVIAESAPERVSLANIQASRLLGWQIEPPIALNEFMERNRRLNPDGSPIAFDQLPLVAALRRGAVLARREIRIARSDGRSLTLLVNAAPLRDAGDRLTGAVVVFQDITQIKDAEQLKDDFLSLVSHELRTPLTTIRGGAQVLLRDSDQFDPETRRELLTDLIGESERLAGLVENMVQLANIRAGRLSMEMEPILVRRLVGRAVAAIDLEEPRRDVRLSVARSLLALGDAARLDQVLRNLLQNAVKYSPPGTPIEITGERDGDMVVLGVRDYGPGIDPDARGVMFERFQRGRQARESGVSGMGLGLYLAQQLVEAHGGAIWIEDPPGGGTLVKLAIPALQDDDDL